MSRTHKDKNARNKRLRKQGRGWQIKLERDLRLKRKKAKEDKRQCLAEPKL